MSWKGLTFAAVGALGLLGAAALFLYPTVAEQLYSGDGELKVEQDAPLLVRHHLMLPAFNVAGETSHDFELSNFLHYGNSDVSVCFETVNPVDPLSLEAQIKLSVTTSDGRTVLSLDEPLNDSERFKDMEEREYRALQRTGFGYWLLSASDGEKQSRRTCFSAMRVGDKFEPHWLDDYTLSLAISNLDDDLKAAVVQVEIRKGWK